MTFLKSPIQPISYKTFDLCKHLKVMDLKAEVKENPWQSREQRLVNLENDVIVLKEKVADLKEFEKNVKNAFAFLKIDISNMPEPPNQKNKTGKEEESDNHSAKPK